jgi:DNA-binding transcriptional ArsR family regulator
MSAGELAEHFDVSKATMSAHFAVLRSGAVYLGSFLFAPIPDARRISSITGVAALLLIASLVDMARGHREQGADRRRRTRPAQVDALARARVERSVAETPLR